MSKEKGDIAEKKAVSFLKNLHYEIIKTNLFAKKRRTNKKSAYKFKHKFTAKDYGWMVLSSLKNISGSHREVRLWFYVGLITVLPWF